MRHRIALGALVALAALTFAANAFAHARVSPPVAIAKESQVFTLAVPTEKENAQTTSVELTLPAGFSIDSFVPAAGWKRVVQSTGSGEAAVIQKVTWTGGSVPTGEDAAFSFLALTERREDVHVLGAADLLRRLRRRLDRAGVVGCAGSDAEGGDLARRRHVDPRHRRARARRDRAHRRRRRPARPRWQDARMTARLIASLVALAAGVTAVVIVLLLLHGTPGPQ